jgi:hypothetical protein
MSKLAIFRAGIRELGTIQKVYQIVDEYFEQFGA